MPRSAVRERNRIAVTLDMTWNLRRHTDLFAGIARFAQTNTQWQCTVDDFAHDTLAEHTARTCPYDGIIGRVSCRCALLAED